MTELRRRRDVKFLLQDSLQIPGLKQALPWRRSLRARRYLLRVRPQDGAVELVVPARSSAIRAAAFASENIGWIKAKLALQPSRIRFQAGLELDVLGRKRVIEHRPELRGGVWLERDRILVAGQAEHFNRRVTDWLKALARQEIAKRVRMAAAQVGKPVGRITVRDTSSRWGSCSVDGNLSFSWRLVLAPEGVLDYVVAHEVAHLKEMNHGPRFWTLVELLAPGTSMYREWLRDNGLRLLRYG